MGFVKEKMTLWPQTVDDDFVDRLHHHYTCALLLLFAAIGFLCAAPRSSYPHSFSHDHSELACSFAYELESELSSFTLLQPEAHYSYLQVLVLVFVRAASRSSARRSSVSCPPTTKGYYSSSYR